MDEPFRLTPPPTPKKRAKFTEPEPKTQAVLFSGLGCLPNQSDLFQTNGQKEMKDDSELSS